MGASTGLVLSATGISFANEWWNTDKLNFKIIMAGMGVALFFDGIEKLSPKAATGLATMMMITVLVTPIDGKSPFQTLNSVVNPPKPKLTKAGTSLERAE